MRHFVSYYKDSAVCTIILEATDETSLTCAMEQNGIPTNMSNDINTDGYVYINVMPHGHEWASEQIEKSSKIYYEKIAKKCMADC